MKKFVIAAIAATLIIGVFAAFMYLKINGDPYAYKEVEQKVKLYLTEEQGYSLEDIDQLVIEHVPMKRPGYYAKVVFKDEPQTTYLYCPQGEDAHIAPCGEEVTSAS